MKVWVPCDFGEKMKIKKFKLPECAFNEGIFTGIAINLFHPYPCSHY